MLRRGLAIHLLIFFELAIRVSSLECCGLIHKRKLGLEITACASRSFCALCFLAIFSIWLGKVQSPIWSLAESIARDLFFSWKEPAVVVALIGIRCLHLPLDKFRVVETLIVHWVFVAIIKWRRGILHAVKLSFDCLRVHVAQIIIGMKRNLHHAMGLWRLPNLLLWMGALPQSERESRVTITEVWCHWRGRELFILKMACRGMPSVIRRQSVRIVVLSL